MLELRHVVRVDYFAEDLFDDVDEELLAVGLELVQVLDNGSGVAVEDCLAREPFHFFHAELHESEQHIELGEDEAERFEDIGAQLAELFTNACQVLVRGDHALLQAEVEHVERVHVQFLELDGDLDGAEAQEDLAVPEQRMLATGHTSIQILVSGLRHRNVLVVEELLEQLEE